MPRSIDFMRRNGGLDLTLSWSELSLGDMIGDNGMGS